MKGLLFCCSVTFDEAGTDTFNSDFLKHKQLLYLMGAWLLDKVAQQVGGGHNLCQLGEELSLRPLH